MGQRAHPCIQKIISQKLFNQLLFCKFLFVNKHSEYHILPVEVLMFKRLFFIRTFLQTPKKGALPHGRGKEPTRAGHSAQW